MGLNIFSGLNRVGQALQTAGQLLASKANPASMKAYRVVVEVDVKAPNKRSVTQTIKTLKQKLKNTGGGGGLVAKMLGIGPDVEVVGIDVRVEKPVGDVKESGDGQSEVEEAPGDEAEAGEAEAGEEPGGDQA